jgi:hypothetical protein
MANLRADEDTNMSRAIPRKSVGAGLGQARGQSSRPIAATPAPYGKWASDALLDTESRIPLQPCDEVTIPLSWSTLPALQRRKGLVIELFGPAASGKTTFARALEAALNVRGVPVRLIGSSRPAEKSSRQPGGGMQAGSMLRAPLARASKLFTALGAMAPGVAIDPLVGRLMEALPPISWVKSIRVRRYLRNLCGSWNAALASDRVAIFDQGFMNSLCSLALFSGAVDRRVISRGLSLVPVPDLLIRVETPRDVLRARLEERLHRQGAFERLFESGIETSLRQIELSAILDDLLAERGRHSTRVSWHGRDGLAAAVEAIADGIVSRRERGST